MRDLSDAFTLGENLSSISLLAVTRCQVSSGDTMPREMYRALQSVAPNPSPGKINMLLTCDGVCTPIQYHRFEW